MRDFFVVFCRESERCVRIRATNMSTAIDYAVGMGLPVAIVMVAGVDVSLDTVWRDGVVCGDVPLYVAD